MPFAINVGDQRVSEPHKSHACYDRVQSSVFHMSGLRFQRSGHQFSDCRPYQCTVRVGGTPDLPGRRQLDPAYLQSAPTAYWHIPLHWTGELQLRCSSCAKHFEARCQSSLTAAGQRPRVRVQPGTCCRSISSWPMMPRYLPTRS